MASRRKYDVTEQKYKRYIAEGRGTGSGKDHKPWLKVQDFPSKGRVHRVNGMTTGRVHHLMSDGEYHFFNACDWDDDVTDIREQFALPRTETYRIAWQMKVRHPVTKDGTPWVLTSDFLLVVGEGDRRRIIVRTFKMSDELGNERTLDKLEIERRYWEEKNVDWEIVTEKDLNIILSRNVKSIRPYYDLKGREGLDSETVSFITKEILNPENIKQDISLGKYCDQLDFRYGLKKGVSLKVAKHLIAHKKMATSMSSSKPFGQRLFSEIKPDE